MFKKEFIEGFAKQIKDMVFQRLNNLKDKDIKDIDKDSISRILDGLKGFISLYQSDIEISHLIEST